MPTQIDLQDKPMSLSPGFAYEHGGGDEIVVSAFQGPYEMSESQTLKPGDTVDSENQLTAFTLGEARLLQYSPEEKLPKAKSEKKPAAKKTKAPSKKKK